MVKLHRIFRAFTIVELLIIIIVIGILAGITIISYVGWQHRIAENTVQSDLLQATSGLSSYQNFKDDYPPNLAGIGFAPSENVALTLLTNAPQTRVYQNLTADQNAQLLLNSCNANMPITSSDGQTTYNTTCTFAGNNLHVSGTNSSNIVIQGPTIQSGDFTLNCGATCDTAVTNIINDFTDQGGTFPIEVPQKQSTLPEFSLETYGAATRYCMEGRASNFSDVVYHVSSETKVVTDRRMSEG